MDSQHFDNLVRQWIGGASRRRLLALLASSAVAAAGAGDMLAKKGKGKKKRRRQCRAGNLPRLGPCSGRKCRNAPGSGVPGPATLGGRKACLPPAQCGPGAPADAAMAQSICDAVQQGNCDKNDDCPIPQDCKAHVVAGSVVTALNCVNNGQQNCPANQVECECTADILAGNAVSCDCVCR